MQLIHYYGSIDLRKWVKYTYSTLLASLYYNLYNNVLPIFKLFCMFVYTYNPMLGISRSYLLILIVVCISSPRHHFILHNMYLTYLATSDKAPQEQGH